MKFIRYTQGYKYQLEEDYTEQIGITPAAPGGNRFVHLTLDGLLIIRAGYAWDGPSGPTIDTPSFMRAALKHDAGYQLIRLGVLTMAHRKSLDEMLRETCIEDGMLRVRAWWVYQAVRIFGESYMQVDQLGVITAPGPRAAS
jgi:hypothetical protein